MGHNAHGIIRKFQLKLQLILLDYRLKTVRMKNYVRVLMYTY